LDDIVGYMIKDNLEKIKKEIGDVKLIAVTKGRNVDEINELIRCGVKVIGENRVNEAEEKFKHIENVEKHMIGHLQTNKVKKAVELFDCIQSVDSLRLALEIDKRSVKKMPIMLEIKFEEQKYGFLVDEVIDAYDKIRKLKNIEVIGLMCMAPFVEAEETRKYFRKMKKINSRLKLKYLSMGMSNDYNIAIDEGSNMVRIGTKLFI